MATDFASSVSFGLGLSKRIFYGKGAAPPASPEMSRSPEEYLPTAPMAYAVVPDPSAVDNPDVPSYQPYVHGRCDPPALIPLQMHGVSAEIDCYLDTAFITVSGVWRLHCVMASRRCDCRVAIPMGDQGLLLGVEINVSGRSYNSELIESDEMKEAGELARARDDGQFLKFRTFTFRVPQVDGGSTLSVKATWSQKLAYHDSEYLLTVPFSFPEYVNPVAKKISKKQKIQLNVNTGISTEVLCRSTSHPMKESRREVGKLSFSYGAEVSAWSSADIEFSYAVSSSDICGEVLLQSPPLHDSDQRELLCLHLYPGDNKSMKVFRKEVVYVIDISGSMKDLLTNATAALLESLSSLDPQDSFNVIAFNEEAYLFSPSMGTATKEAVSSASRWITKTFVGNGGTNILLPLEQAVKLLSDTTDAIPLVFLVTDGTVENEIEICKTMKSHFLSGTSVRPRVCTFGIGPYCNHYFLRALAQVGRGHYDAALDEESVSARLKSFFNACSSVVISNIALDFADKLESLQLFPSHIPDLSSGSPLIVTGRYSGEFSESVRVTGTLADGNVYTKHLNVKWAKDIPLDRVLAKRQIDVMTADAWLQGSKELEEKVSEMSVRYGVPSEYTCMILLETVSGKVAPVQKAFVKEVYNKMSFKKMVEWKGQKAIVLGCLEKGFGDLEATRKNIKPGTEEPKPADAASILVNAASSCCSRLMNRICCMCFISTCSHLNNQCAVVFTQISTALACFECLNCCFEVCECCSCLG